MISRFSRPAEVAALAALALGVALLATPLAPALAAPVERQISAASTQATAAVADATGSVAKPADDEAACQKARRKLWVAGEGWIVRRVTTCH